MIRVYRFGEGGRKSHNGQGSHSGHGGTKAPEYYCWTSMIQRCFNSQKACYPRYGGRGITVDDRWLNFDRFLEDMGPRPSKNHSIERKDNDKNYCPENCIWATAKEQARNSPHNHLVTFQGQTMCVSEWAEKLGMNYGTLHSRLKRMSLDDAMTRPVRERYSELIKFDGHERTLGEWAKLIGTSSSDLTWRIRQWGFEAALTRPIRQRRKKTKGLSREKRNSNQRGLFSPQ